MDPLSARVIDDALVYPTIRVASHPGKLLMGVFDGDDEFVEGTVLDRRAGEQGAPMPRGLLPTVAESEEPEAIYLGPLYVHFGHFLLESLARTWYAARHPGLPLVWAGAHTWQGAQLRPWQQEILQLLGLHDRTQIIADPTRFARLHVPDIGYRYDDRFHPDHAAFLATHDGPAQVRGHRLWLSRTTVGSDVRDLNASATERRLSWAGWTVIHPETLSIRQQLDHLARAEIIAGEEGSAFHSLILLKNVAAKKFHIFRRYGREHSSLITIGDARHVTQSFHSLERERVLEAKGRVVSKLNPNSSEILDTLGVAVPPEPDGSTRSAANRVLDQVVEGLRPDRLLEIGAAAPFVIAASTAATRVSVCPRFGFDPRSYAESGIDFYELDIASYVQHFHGDRGPFDVIRLAGSKFETVLRSFRASKSLGHEATTWLLGSGEVGARLAAAIELAHPGFAAKRLRVQRTTIFIAQRVVGEPTDDEEVANLSTADVRRLNRWLPRAHLGHAQETDSARR